MLRTRIALRKTYYLESVLDSRFLSHFENADTLFIFVDESGNFDFTAKGTKHFIVTYLITSDPSTNEAIFSNLKYMLLSQGVDVSEFHASENKQNIRNIVFEHINKMTGCYAITFWCEKSNLDDALREPVALYRLFFANFMDALYSSNFSRLFKLVVIFDRALPVKKEKLLLGIIRSELKRMAFENYVYFHNANRDFLSQVADYIAWSHYVGIERGELRPTAALPWWALDLTLDKKIT